MLCTNYYTQLPREFGFHQSNPGVSVPTSDTSGQSHLGPAPVHLRCHLRERLVAVGEGL